VERLN